MIGPEEPPPCTQSTRALRRGFGGVSAGCGAGGAGGTASAGGFTCALSLLARYFMRMPSRQLTKKE